MTNLTDWDFVQVRDFEYLNSLFDEIKEPFRASAMDPMGIKCYKTGFCWSKDYMWEQVNDLGDKLRKGLGMEIAELGEHESRFFKAAHTNMPRMNKMFTEEELNELRRINR
jgi:hypothetical protein